MQYNNSSMNTRVRKGNQYTQDMMIDPREFVMGAGEYDYKEMPPMQPCKPNIPPMQPCKPNIPPMQPCKENMPGSCNQGCSSHQICNEPCEPILATDVEYSACTPVNCDSCQKTCCDNSIVPPPITSANSMTRLISGYQISDFIKFDRVAVSPNEVTLTVPDRNVTVSGAPLPVGTYKFNITEVCFGDLELDIEPGTITIGGEPFESEDDPEQQSTVFTTTYNRLVRTPVNSTASRKCCKQGLGTAIEYNQPDLTATLKASSDEEATTKPINVILRGKCGCTNIQAEATFNPTGAGTFTFDVLNGTLCRRPDLSPVLSEQYYQSKLTLGCVNATIESTGMAYKVTVQPVYLNLIMRVSVSLLNYGALAVLSTQESIKGRDIPVQKANFDFDSCLK